MEKTYARTNLYIVDKDLWKWAKFRANTIGKASVSEYLFELIKQDKRTPLPLELETSLQKLEIDLEENVDTSEIDHVAIQGLKSLITQIREKGIHKVGEKKEDGQ